MTPDILDSEIKLNGYNLYRKDRENRSHGGVAIYVKENIISKEINSFSNGVCEYISVELNVNGRKTEILSIYRPPDTSNREFDDIVEFIEDTSLSRSKESILIGDLNLPNIKWNGSSLQNVPCPDYVGSQAKKLKDITDRLFMTQYISKPTRNSNILDLLYCNNEYLIQKIDITPTIYSDHNIINVETNIIINEKRHESYEEKIKNPLCNVNIHSANFTVINDELEKIEWEKELENKSPNECYEFITQKITDLVIENSKKKKKGKKISPEYRFRRVLWRKRRKYEIRLRNQPNNDSIKQNIMKFEQEIKTSYESEEKRVENDAVNKIKTNSKYFYSYAKRTTKLNNSIVQMEDRDGIVKIDREEICNILQDQYVSAFSKPSNSPTTHTDVPISKNKSDIYTTNSGETPDDDINNLDHIDFNVEDIKKAIKDIPTNSAPGPDGITPKILKDCKDVLSYPLYIMWKKSVDSGEIPYLCKKSFIVPIHKKGDRDKPGNYRPISLTSQLIKLFERILKKHLVNHLESNSLIGNFQHGFRKGRSCLTQLLDHYTEIFNNINSGNNVDVIYLDFARAFDKVDHRILLNKVKKLKIIGEVLNWLKSFILNRTQTVVLEGSQSKEEYVQSGVPQGTVLAPLLFIIMINDLPDVLKHCSLKSFADDTKLIKIIQNIDDHEKMKEDLKSVYQWSDNNNLPFNCNKFTLIRYKTKENDDVYEYFAPDGTKIDQDDKVRDLGVIMSSNLKFKDHIKFISTRCRQLSGWILRTFKTREQLPLLTLWKSLVLSRLDYCSQLWSPIKVGEMQEIEALQRTFTSHIHGLAYFQDYWDRLITLKLYSVERRFERYSIIYAWKIIEQECLYPEPYQTTDINSRTGRKFIYYYPINSNKCRAYNTPFNRLKKAFNSLPKDLRNMSDVSTEKFKSHLDGFLSIIPDQPNVPGYKRNRACATNLIADQYQYILMGGDPVMASSLASNILQCP